MANLAWMREKEANEIVYFSVIPLENLGRKEYKTGVTENYAKVYFLRPLTCII